MISFSNINNIDNDIINIESNIGECIVILLILIAILRKLTVI